MRINKEDVEHVGKLARLQLDTEEVEAFSGQLSRILDYMDELKEVDVSGLQAENLEEDHSNVWREDVPQASLPHDKAVANGPEVIDGFFSVPKIIGNR